MSPISAVAPGHNDCAQVIIDLTERGLYLGRVSGPLEDSSCHVSQFICSNLRVFASSGPAAQKMPLFIATTRISRSAKPRSVPFMYENPREPPTLLLLLFSDPALAPHCPPCHPQVVLKSKDDQVTVIGAGVTLHEALAAAEILKKGKKKGTRKVTGWSHRISS